MKLLLFITLISLAWCGDKNAWKSRAIYQLLTDRFAIGDGSTPSCSNLGDYCGGNFQGIINNLNYIQGMGFDSIWISPVVSNTPGGYHGYWAGDWTTINSHFGNDGTTSSASQMLQALSSALHNQNMWLMIDVVANHVGPVGTNYSTIVPFNASTYYHKYCNIESQDFGPNGNATIVQFQKNCRLSGLPDLDQNNSFVQSTLLSWINNLVSTYSADGIRIDTVPEVPQWFWSLYAQSAGVYQVGEVFDGHIGYVAGFQQPSGPLTALLNYPLYYAAKTAFGYGQTMYNLQTFTQQMNSTFPDQSVLGNFVDNHDNARFLSYQSSYKRLENYITYILTSSGIPIFYYGTEQGFNGGNDPDNREIMWGNFNTNAQLYQFVATINSCRTSTQYYQYEQIQRYAQSDFYAFSRGTTFMAFTNSDSDISYPITYHPYSNGQTICNIFYPTADCITIANNQFTIYLNNGETKIYVLQSGEQEKAFLQ